jgi:hypothetical protein
VSSYRPTKMLINAAVSTYQPCELGIMACMTDEEADQHYADNR